MMNTRALAKHDDLIRRYRHKTKGGIYTLVDTALSAGELKSTCSSIVMYRNQHGVVFARSSKCFNDNMEIIKTSVSETMPDYIAY